jgi:hypothetical protein
MKKVITLAACMLAAYTYSTAQTLNVVVGEVTYAIPASQAGEMTYSNGSTVSILGKDFALSDVNRMYVDNSKVTDNSVQIVYSGSTASVVVAGNVAKHLTITADGSNVSIIQGEDVADEITYTLSGESSDGSFYMDGKYKASFVLNGLKLTSQSGAAIDIEDGKRISVELASGTENVLEDAASGKQKACFMVNGHTEFKGGGSLTITGNAKHGFWGDEYVEVKKTVGSITIAKSVKDGFNINQYFQQNGGTIVVKNVGDDGIQVSKTDDDTDENNGQVIIKGGSLEIAVTADAVKGLKAEDAITISGGTINITTSGNGAWDSDDNETKASAAIKSDTNITITDGELNLSSSGTGGKGISCDGDLQIDGGNINIVTTGSQYVYSSGSSNGGNNGGWGGGFGGGFGGGWGGGNNGNSDNVASNLKSSPKGIKVDGNITINGGTIIAKTSGSGAEGIESKSVLTINDGTIEVTAYDDAINSGSHMYINGGKIYVNSSNNDGLDSNGNLYLNGGLVVAYGTTSPECGLDANDEGGYGIYVNGATVIGVGGGTSYPKSGSTVPTMIYSGSVSNGASILVTDASGNGVLGFKMSKSYSGSVKFFISSPDLTKGSSYKLYKSSSISGDDWHGLYSPVTVTSTGTSAGSVSSLSLPYSSVGSSNNRP